MGYLVVSSGRVTLAEEAEADALARARTRMLDVRDSGWLDADVELHDLGDLAEFAAGAALARDGDVLVVSTHEDSDPKWSDQARAFWEGLAEAGATGRVDLEGEDGARWSYALTAGAVEQTGHNGWDGTGDGYGWEGGGAFGDPDDDGPWEDAPRAAAPALREALRFTPEQQARRARRYLAFGGLATVGGIGLLAADRPTGWLALGIGALDLAIGARAHRRALAGDG